MFTQRMTEAETAALYRTAADVAELLDALGLTWWLSHGSLYGSWCFRGVIPWDDDLDVAAPLDRAGDIEHHARLGGWRFLRVHPFLAKLWRHDDALHRTRHPWTWPFVDLALYERCPQGTVRVEHCHCTRFETFQEHELLPTRPHPFGGLTLPIPARPELFLDGLYKDWRTRSLSNSWNHRLERRYPEPAVWVSNAELAARFPMYNVGPAPVG